MAIIDQQNAKAGTDARAFACPGLYRIVPAKDGGICRVRIPLGTMTAKQARAISAVAQTSGNGIIELTNRANVQIRGMAAGDAPLLISRLVDAGLAPPARWADDTRNVLVNPSAGWDRMDIVDVRPLAAQILDRLTGDDVYAVLSPKFSIQIDGGGAMSVADHAHDIWLLAVDMDGHGPMFKVGLAGVLDDRRDGASVRFVAPSECVAIVCALIDEFIDLGVRQHGVSRLRDLLRLIGQGDIWRRLERRLGRPLLKFPADRVYSHATPTTRPPLGLIAGRDADRCALGAMPLLGRLGADVLNAVARVAEDFGSGEIRLTPWRSVLIANVTPVQVSAALNALRSAGLIVEQGDGLAHMISCSGSAGCISALADVQADAVRLASLVAPSDASIHVSGCAKSCAVPGTSDVTLVAVGEGLYDLYQRDAAAPEKFGRRIATHVDLQRAACLLNGVPA